MSHGRAAQNMRVPFQSGMVLHDEQGVLRLSVQPDRLLQTRLRSGRRCRKARHRDQQKSAGTFHTGKSRMFDEK